MSTHKNVMVVLASSIVTKSGKALVSRQFVDMSRVRIEGLLAAFPKLVGSGQQHTYVETENVRYVYQPMEALYLLLVTNKASNILEDLETLRLLAKVVPEYIVSLDEEGITEAAFSLLFAFDEVISLGYKENVTVFQVKQNTEMESHEEKLHKMIIQSKINDTKDIMKRKAMEIDKHKIERREGRSGAGYPSGGMGGMPSGGLSEAGSMSLPPAVSKPFSGSSAAAAGLGRPKPKGMQLGKAKKANDFLDAMTKEGDVMSLGTSSAAAAGAGGAAAQALVPSEPVSIAVDERLVVRLNKDGGMETMEVQGTMSLQVMQDDSARITVATSAGENAGYQFKTHPNIDKAAYNADGTLRLKDPTRPFPTGNALGILKWRLQTTDDSLAPLSINCWPSTSGEESYVNIEYEAIEGIDLQTVVIAIPLPALSQAPKVSQVDGDYKYDARQSTMLWTIDLIDDQNRSGTMEFVVPACDGGNFFPVEANFTATKTLCDVQVVSVSANDTEAPVKFAYSTLLSTDEYQVS